MAPSCPWPGTAVPSGTEFSPYHSCLLSAVCPEVRTLPHHSPDPERGESQTLVSQGCGCTYTLTGRKTTAPLLCAAC